MLALLVSIGVAVLLMYPYAATVVLRRRALKKLRKTVRRARGRMRPLKKAVSLCRNRSRCYDLLIEKGSVVYAVKLWSAIRPHTDLCVARDGKLFEEREIPTPLRTEKNRQKRTVRCPILPIPKTKYTFSVPKGKDLRRVLLIYPSYRSIRCETKDAWREIHTGDTLFEKTVFSPSAFSAFLLENSAPSFEESVSDEETSLKK